MAANSASSDGNSYKNQFLAFKNIVRIYVGDSLTFVIKSLRHYAPFS